MPFFNAELDLLPPTGALRNQYMTPMMYTGGQVKQQSCHQDKVQVTSIIPILRIY